MRHSQNTRERAAPAAPRIEIVVPVHNEQAILGRSIRRLHRFLSAGIPFAWRIVIADNASTDDTRQIALALTHELSNTELLHVPTKGRGGALRAAWSASDADVLCYMDVDLSTDLRAVFPLVAALVSGHSDLAIGSRLAHGAHVVRGRKREVISRAYNRLLRVILGARFSDAQCGFKAIRTDVAERLLPEVRDEGWFFDTELLVLAQRHGLRVHEVAVDWVENADSRVEIVRTAWLDLCGVGRLALQTQLTRFLIVGVLSTVAYAAVYLGLRAGLAPAAANALALAVTAVANTQANRRFTFELTGREKLLRQHAAGALVYVLTLGLTTAALAVLSELALHASRLLEIVVLVLACGVATVSRYLALRTWVFATGNSAAPLVKLSSSSQLTRR